MRNRCGRLDAEQFIPTKLDLGCDPRVLMAGDHDSELRVGGVVRQVADVDEALVFGTSVIGNADGAPHVALASDFFGDGAKVRCHGRAVRA